MPYRLAIPQNLIKGGRRESNPRVSAPQADVLTTSPRPPKCETRAAGIEPTPKVLETFVLPLNYARKGNMEGEGFEPPNPKERIYSPPRLATSLPFQIMFFSLGINLMGVNGIEPLTLCL